MAKQETENIEGAGWRPTDGDVLSGKIVAIGKAWSDWSNEFYPLVTVHDDTQDEDVDVHCFHHTLKSALMENRPLVGDAIEISYLGKRKTKDGKREVAIYKVTLPGATGANVWDDLGAQSRTAARAAAQGEIPVDTSGLPGADDDIPF